MTSSRASIWRTFFIATILSAVALLFCSQSSPLYPINDWSDANIYFSMGKGMLDGKVIYRDLYDHKGPLLYALHALCALVSPMSFAGVYVLEALCAGAFLTVADRLLALYGVKRPRWIALMLLALAVYGSFSFLQGDSAEELCLPLMLYALYDLLRHLKTDGDKPMSFGRVVVGGAVFGCVFWVKFTMCGVFAAYLLVLVVQAIARRRWKAAFIYIGGYALGFAISTLPWLIYFGLNGALLPWLKTYLYDNLFLYSEGETTGLLSRVKEMGKSGLSWLQLNLIYTVPLAFGLLWTVFKRNAAPWEKPAVLLSAGLAALGVFIGGKSYPYYGLALAMLAPLGFIAPCLWVQGFAERRGWRLCNRALLAGFCLLWLVLVAVISPNPRRSMLKPREETMQYRLAAVMADYDRPTLINYGFMDAGFFTASGIVPSVKYFHRTNVPLREMIDEQNRYVNEAVCDFVVARGALPDSAADKYELVATSDTPSDFWYDQVCLYRRKGLLPAV